MKHFIIQIICCSLAIKGYTLYQGNPSSCELPRLGWFIPEDKALSFKLGYQANKVFSKEMFLDKNQKAGLLQLDSMSSFTNQGVFTLSIIDRVEVFATAGSMTLSRCKGSFEGDCWQATSSSDFVWSVGGRALLLLWGYTSFGAEASYLSSSPHLNSLKIGKERVSWTYDHLMYDEWQIELALSHEISFFSLYAGGAYSYTTLNVNIPAYAIDAIYKNAHKLSLVTGISISAKRGLTANIEGKWFGEKSLGGSLDLRF